MWDSFTTGGSTLAAFSSSGALSSSTGMSVMGGVGIASGNTGAGSTSMSALMTSSMTSDEVMGDLGSFDDDVTFTHGAADDLFPFRGDSAQAVL